MEACIYDEQVAEEVEQQLSSVQVALVWVNPVQAGKTRAQLNALLRRVSDRGVLVSAHPQTISQLGTKQVLFDTRRMSWSADVKMYTGLAELRAALEEAGPEARVFKQLGGNDGHGVFRVQRVGGAWLVRHAASGSLELTLTLEQLLALLAPYLKASGRIIDQAFQERIAEGTVRCYLVRDQVVGFGAQAVNALCPPGPDGTVPLLTKRVYYDAQEASFQALRAQMGREWLPELGPLLGLDRGDLPLIWDANFLLGPRVHGLHSYRLGEINVSSVYPFPDAALKPLARATRAALERQSLDGAGGEALD